MRYPFAIALGLAGLTWLVWVGLTSRLWFSWPTSSRKADQIIARRYR